MGDFGRLPEPRLAFLFQIRLYFSTRLRFPADTAGAEVGFVLIARGEIEGPRLNGQVLPNSGGDWAHIRPDGVVVHNAHYILQAEDSAYIYMRNTGYHVYPNKELVGQLADLTPQQRAADYFRVTPVFETAAPAHAWLARTVIIGAGERRVNPDHSVFDYHAVL